ncbi:MAG: hypothetical protein E6J40_12475 [Chloroflexi bacterium]|nr:MAG: hypothetical protein E6J40_12475 [Chloroflexota bacterium]
MLQRLLASLIVVAAVTVASVVPAAASCASGGPRSIGDQIASSSIVFVGTVLYTSDQDRVARVKVESIWKGPSMAAYVYVHGSPVSGPFTFSSVDRRYQAGQRYLFVPVNDRMPFDDNSCSLTQPYTSELAALAPRGARSPASATFNDYVQNFTGQYAWSAPLVVLLVVSVATIAIVRGRRRRTPQ